MADKPIPRKPQTPAAARPAVPTSRPAAARPGNGQPAALGRPVAARPLPAGAATRPVPAGQQRMRQYGEQRAAAEDSGDDESEDEAAAAWNMLLRQSPSWLTSLVVHMVLILILALCVSAPTVVQSVRELVIGKPDIADKKLDEGAKEQPSDKQALSDLKVDTDLTSDVAIPIDTAVDAPTAQFKTDHDDLTFAAAKVEFTDFGTEGAQSGTGDSGGIHGSGLGSRSSAGKKRAARMAGAGAGTDEAVEGALRWLAEHQNGDGSWSFPHTPGGKCNGFPNPGSAKADMGATGLALLAFLGAGYTHKPIKDSSASSNNKHQDVVKRGINYLVGHMTILPEGGKLFEKSGNPQFHMYSHGIAACALAEAFGMTQDKQLKQPAQLALNYIYNAQDPASGGWLYTPKAGGDTSVVGWQIMAIKSGKMSYLEVPKQVAPLANKWLDSVSWNDGAAYGYRGKNDRGPAEACTAIGLLCRNYLGWKKDNPGLIGGVKALSAQGPVKDNMYYNYYAAMVMYQNDGPKGEMWREWNKKMEHHLKSTQVREGKEAGSWHFDGGHGDHGGRVYNTAMAAMTLEVYYRYLPVYQQANVARDDFPVE